MIVCDWCGVGRDALPTVVHSLRPDGTAIQDNMSMKKDLCPKCAVRLGDAIKATAEKIQSESIRS